MPEHDAERTEAATPRRRQEAREEGNIARSPDLTAACSLLGAVVLLQLLGFKALGVMKAAMEAFLSPGGLSGNPTRVDDLGSLAAYAGGVVVVAGGPLVLGVMAVGLLATVAQVGLVFTTKPLEPSLAKLSPLKGLSHLFDRRAAVRLGMSLAKLAAVAGLAAALVIRDLPAVLALGSLDTLPLFAAACGLVYGLALKLASALLVLALLDYAAQRWMREGDLRMTKQEVKEELKRMEGDPLVKQRRSRVARQLMLQRIGQAVPAADVVVTNPTHFAVALKYDAATMRSPKVVAKGADHLAMRIRQLALASGVPLVERKEVARALYKSVEVGQEVPPDLYTAVAEILAYVYRLSGRKSA